MHQMQNKKMFITIAVFVLLAVVFFANKYHEARIDRRAKFLVPLGALKEAHFTHEGFTNDSFTVYSYINQFIVGGTNYQCEFAVQSDFYFEGKGFLAMTTNVDYVWIDKKRGAIPLIRPQIFPPGF
jgi:hypothetical protein